MVFFYRAGLLVALAVFMFSSAFGANHDNYYRSFWMPEYNGLRLDYCSYDHKECGLAIANRYCHMMGYSHANHQVIANNVGLTSFFGRHTGCQGWRCNGFKTIRCVNKISHKPPQTYHYRLQRFVLPRFNNYRIAWCYDGKKGCGQRAAYSFCRRLGYLQVKHFLIQKSIAATQAIGNQKLCFGKNCNAFKEIDCYR